MCGIAGLLELRHAAGPVDLLDAAARMVGPLAHRGPDDLGTWADRAAGIAFGHRRLSVVDTSGAGHQPMVSADARYVLSFNGEVYNHQELRADLERRGAEFRSRSDTEVLLERIARFGVREALEPVNGMFAFAVWDRQERLLTLARDRLGEKPLVYGVIDGRFAFASELSALRHAPGYRHEVDRHAVGLHLRHGYVPAPRTIIRGISKLPPGHLVEVHRGGTVHEPEPYWSLEDAAEAGLARPIEEDGALAALRDLIGDSVALRMLADVPVGALLSGGVDSSLVVALVQQRATRPVRTFSIGFAAAGYDESPFAREVAERLGTDHTEMVLTDGDVREALPPALAAYDEPFADSSQLPTFLVSRLARRDVTVALSGDGGDELFGGYDRYRVFRRTWPALERTPTFVRRPLSALALSTTSDRIDRAAATLRRFGVRAASVTRPGEKVHRLARLAHAPGPDQAYDQLTALWEDPGDVLPGWRADTCTARTGAHVPEPSRRFQLFDQGRYLPDDLLVKLDRASMAVSLEARVPLLDHRIVELSWRFPTEVLYRDGRGKWPLRALLAEHLPARLIDRPKMGFGVPLAAWLRGPLRDWAEELLSTRPPALEAIDVDAVRVEWSTLAAGGSERTAGRLWSALTLLEWANR